MITGLVTDESDIESPMIITNNNKTTTRATSTNSPKISRRKKCCRRLSFSKCGIGGNGSGSSSGGGSSNSGGESVNQSSIDTTTELQAMPLESSPASSSSSSPSKIKKRMVSCKKPYDAFIDSIPATSSLTRIIHIDNADSMILLAGVNLQNRSDIVLMEWSEYVFIQLCTLKRIINPADYSWSHLKEYVIGYEWATEVVHNLKQFAGPNLSLMSILDTNHKYKYDSKILTDWDVVFATTPRIDYNTLQTYKLPLNAIYGLNDKLPVKFKRVPV